MRCPVGKAWFGRPAAALGDAHLQLVECSGAGRCDRGTGVCACSPGFEGGACSRMVCPGPPNLPCGGHGQCATMAQLAEAARTNGDPTAFAYGDVPNAVGQWDHDMVQGCLCDAGYSGHDCGLRTCPLGDDPDTAGQVNAVQTLTCLDTDASGTLGFSFRGASTAATAVSATSTAAQVHYFFCDIDAHCCIR
jgi:hypothetical protein